MPLVACPKCKTTLKFPDGASGNIKCPKCNTVFALAAKPAAPAFEVVDEAPPRPAPPAPRPAPAPLPPPPRARAAETDDFEVVEEPRRKPRRNDDYDDEDDRPRGRGRGRRDDYDDEDDDRGRPRRRSRRRDDDYDDEDDDDYDRRPGGGKAAAMGHAKVGMLLLTISSWLYFALYCLFTLAVIIIWANVGGESSSRSGRGSDSGANFDWVLVLTGIIGLGNWVVAAIGLGFCIAGPKRVRGTAITAASLAGAHLVLTAVCYSIASSKSMGLIGALGGGLGDPAWLVVSTTIPFLNTFLPALVYGSRGITGEYVVVILTGACEVARLLFVLLTIKGLAHASRNNDAADKATTGLVVGSMVIGIAAIVSLFLAVLINEGAFKGGSTGLNLLMAVLFLIYLAYAVMTLFPALAATSATQSLGRRAR